MKPLTFLCIFFCLVISANAQPNLFPLYSSGVTSGGTGDQTNIGNAQLKLEATSSYIRVPHISADGSVSVVYNYQSGKDAYWGEESDAGTYWFRGRNFVVKNGAFLVQSGSVGIGNNNPSAPLHIGATQGSAGTPYAGTTLLKIFQPFNTSILSASIDIGLSQPHGRITGIGNSGDNTLGQLALSTMQAGTVTEVMRLNQYGNVLIGKTSQTNTGNKFFVHIY